MPCLLRAPGTCPSGEQGLPCTLFPPASHTLITCNLLPSIARTVPCSWCAAQDGTGAAVSCVCASSVGRGWAAQVLCCPHQAVLCGKGEQNLPALPWEHGVSTFIPFIGGFSWLVHIAARSDRWSTSSLCPACPNSCTFPSS